MKRRLEVMQCWCGHKTMLRVLGDYYPFKVVFQCRECKNRIVIEVEKKNLK